MILRKRSKIFVYFDTIRNIHSTRTQFYKFECRLTDGFGAKITNFFTRPLKFQFLNRTSTLTSVAPMIYSIDKKINCRNYYSNHFFLQPDQTLFIREGFEITFDHYINDNLESLEFDITLLSCFDSNSCAPTSEYEVMMTHTISVNNVNSDLCIYGRPVIFHHIDDERTTRDFFIEISALFELYTTELYYEDIGSCVINELLVSSNKSTTKYEIYKETTTMLTSLFQKYKLLYYKLIHEFLNKYIHISIQETFHEPIDFSKLKSPELITSPNMSTISYISNIYQILSYNNTLLSLLYNYNINLLICYPLSRYNSSSMKFFSDSELLFELCTGSDESRPFFFYKNDNVKSEHQNIVKHKSKKNLNKKSSTFFQIYLPDIFPKIITDIPIYHFDSNYYYKYISTINDFSKPFAACSKCKYMSPSIHNICEFCRYSMFAKNKQKHFVIFMHGLNANYYGLIDIKNAMNYFCPHLIPIYITSISNMTDQDIEKVGDKVADELDRKVRLKHCDKDISKIGSISIVAHSLGGVLIREAIVNPKLTYLLTKYKVFISFNSPHLGTLGGSSITDIGIKWLKSVSNYVSVKQLAFEDAPDFRNTALYRLNTKPCLSLFSHIVLISSVQDKFVPFSSARIELSHIMSGSQYKQFFHEMIEGLLVSIPQHHIFRFDVNFNINQTNIDTVIGRKAHIMTVKHFNSLYHLFYRIQNFFEE